MELGGRCLTAWREEETFAGIAFLRLPAVHLPPHLIDQSLNTIELHAGYDGADVDGFWSSGEPTRSVLMRSRILPSRTSAMLSCIKGAIRRSRLVLGEPDAIHQAFNALSRSAVFGRR